MTSATSGWTRTTIGAVTSKPQTAVPAETGRRSVRYVDISGIKGPTSVLNDAPGIDAATAPSRCRQVLSTGDTVYSTVRPYLRKSALIGPGLAGEFASTGFCVMRPRDCLLPEYLRYFIQSSHFEDQILPLQKGVSYPAVLDRQVRECSITYPALSEQRRIVDIIEEYFSRLDSAARSLELTRRRVDAVRTATRSALVKGPLVYLGDISLASSYGTSVKCAKDGPGAPVARIPNVQDGRLIMDDVKYASDAGIDLSNLYIKSGDVLIVRTNGSKDLIGRCAVVDESQDVAFASYLIRYRVAPDRMSSAWLGLALSTPRVRDQIVNAAASSAGQYNLSVAKLDALELPCPAPATQSEVALRVNELDENLQRTLKTVVMQAARESVLRGAVLKAAFAGLLTGSASELEALEEVSDSSTPDTRIDTDPKLEGYIRG